MICNSGSSVSQTDVDSSGGGMTHSLTLPLTLSPGLLNHSAFCLGFHKVDFEEVITSFLAMEIIVDQIHRGINTITSFPFSSSPPKTKYISPNINWGVCLQHRQSWSIITATPGN